MTRAPAEPEPSWPRRSWVWLAGPLVLLLGVAIRPVAAQGPQGGSQAPAAPAAVAGYFVPPRSLGTTVEPEPPRYVRPLSTTGLPGTAGLEWLHVGLDYRARVEHRVDDLRRPAPGSDMPLLLRTRAFISLERVLDPLRLTIELEDARRHGSAFAPDGRDVNTMEPIQAYAEIHLARALGNDRPLVARVGRFAFEALDRRLISRNEWRNTTNTFQGVRVKLGERHHAWSAELLAAQPLERRLQALDRQPPRSAGKRRIHTAGLRVFGPAGTRGLDYDVSVHGQRGRTGAASHRAWAATTEIGATFTHAWAPRLAVFYGIVSGDRAPTDTHDERFERLFGFARPWSSNDYFQMENLVTPKASLEVTPRRGLALDTAYAAYWLASATDRWALASLRDPTGASGRFVGHEYNVRARYPLTRRVGVHTGYALFVPGRFPRQLGKSDVSHFGYLELSFNAFQ